jgi:hypothetical protein
VVSVSRRRGFRRLHYLGGHLPVKGITDAEANPIVEGLAPRLADLMEERKIGRQVTAAVGRDEVNPVPQLAKAGPNEEGFYQRS